MYVSLSRIVLVLVLAGSYICFEGYLLLRAFGRNITGRGKTVRKILLWAYWPLFLLAAGLYFYSRYSAGGVRSIFGLVSSSWGLFFMIPFFLLADILSFISFLLRRVPQKFRTAFSTALSTALSTAYSRWIRPAVLVLAGGAIALGSFSAHYPKITNYSVTVEKPLPREGFRVILLSDIHIGAMVRKKELARLVSMINSLEGDLVLIAGDIIDRDLDIYRKENLNEELGAIMASMGVYAVPGNHDYFGGNLRELKEMLAAAGVKLLADELVLLDGVYVIGRNDFSVGRWGGTRKPLSELTAGLDDSLPLILMDHQPVNLSEAEGAGIDLQVSGHTHRGQIWPALIITGRIYENHYGLLYKGKTAVVVTSGCGTWGPPLRIGTRSEIVCIELKNPPGYNGKN